MVMILHSYPFHYRITAELETALASESFFQQLTITQPVQLLQQQETSRASNLQRGFGDFCVAVVVVGRNFFHLPPPLLSAGSPLCYVCVFSQNVCHPFSCARVCVFIKLELISASGTQNALNNRRFTFLFASTPTEL